MDAFSPQSRTIEGVYDASPDLNTDRFQTYSIWTNTLAVTPYATSLSAFILFIRLVWASKPLVSLRTRLSKNGNTPIEPADETTGVNISKYGGSVALTYKTIRALGCLFLLGLSLASLVAPEITTSTPVELEIGLCISYVRDLELSLEIDI